MILQWMLPFVLAAQLALSHGKVFISHQLQGGSQTKVKETFSSRQVSADNINRPRACAWLAHSLSCAHRHILSYGTVIGGGGGGKCNADNESNFHELLINASQSLYGLQVCLLFQNVFASGWLKEDHSLLMLIPSRLFATSGVLG